MDRLWAKVNKGKPNDCWEWQGYKSDGGYGLFYIRRGKRVRAHRIVYEVACGPIPAGLVVRHRCDNPPCCNPRHLDLGTTADNNRDAVERGRHRSPCLKFFGLKNGKAKLSDEAVREIIESSEPASALAQKHGVSAGHIRSVRSGHRRKPSPQPPTADDVASPATLLAAAGECGRFECSSQTAAGAR